MKQKIAIIDYGLGNLFSLQQAIDFLGYDSVVTQDTEEILSSDKLILPGVGAFEAGMKNLEKNNLINTLEACYESGKYILGICLGMQLLMEESEEGGRHKGLGLISGKVTKFQSPDLEDDKYKIPQVGWNKIFPHDNKEASWKSSFLSTTPLNSYFYFVHSYHVQVSDLSDSLAFSEYGKDSFSSVIMKDNLMGTQFHPELSSSQGLNLLKCFIDL